MEKLDILFIVLLSIIFYSYIGYGILLYFVVLIKRLVYRKQTKKIERNQLPSVTLIVAAYNEADFIEKKISNSFDLSYPKEKLEYIFISDGSTDNTPELIANFKKIKLLHKSERRGKTAALNSAVSYANGEIVVFSDANTLLNSEAINEIVKHYENPKCGCVSGEKRIIVPDEAQASAAGEGLYWKYESKLKQLDAELYSATGAAGELFSIRRCLFKAVEEDSILDDFVISLRIVQLNYFIAYEPNAFATEFASDGVEEEIKRKIRICAGGFQSIFRLLPLLNVFKYGIFTIQYVSHRLLRWTLAPLALFLLIPLNIIGVYSGDEFYSFIMIAQIAFYSFSVLGWKFEKLKTRKKIFFIPFYFTLMNYAVFAGFKRFIMGGQSHIWQRAKRATV